MRSEPNIIVTCDRCESYEDEIGLTATAGRGYDERNVDDSLETLGWKVNPDICPDCLAYENEAEAPPEPGERT